jgi:NADH:ubiquinone oxidoreductase subunit 5 (subunit L)/multisubunit Na+/H+ antiporter MnhA subunit
LGDFGLYCGILLFLVFYKTQSISSINGLAFKLDQYHAFLNFFGFRCDLLTFISFFIFLGIVGKSAQLGLHTWLPDAMEGPTPVSALLHAATMVTAGIYVLLRLSFFFQVSNLMTFIAFWGGLTAFVASTIGAFQNDIKKIIAYSTCSQLGYMLAACGLYNFAGAYFHLFNHAFFKALLFLGAGSIIHALGDEQDLRKFGGLLSMLPLTHVALLIGSFSLMGIPFFSGFYSKDIIIN